MTGLAMVEKKRWEKGTLWSFTCQDHEQRASVMRPETWEAGNTRASCQSINCDLSLHAWLQDKGRKQNSIWKRRERRNPVLYIFKCCRRLSCKASGILESLYFFYLFFFSPTWQIRDLILALPLTSRPTRMPSARQHAALNLSDQKCMMSKWTSPPLKKALFSSNGKKSLYVTKISHYLLFFPFSFFSYMLLHHNLPVYY